ncbi:MAG: hypothetical protein AAGD14_11570 [Planctomycetota bacterium]
MSETRARPPWLLIGLGVAVAALLGTAALAYLGYRDAIERAGQEVAVQFRDHPLVRQHLGDDASFAAESMEVDREAGEAVLTLRGRGGKGEGSIVARLRNREGGFDVIAADLHREGAEPDSLLASGE